MRPTPITKNDLRNNQLGEIVRKTITFANDTGTVSVFTVTGDVIVRIVPICKVDVASAAVGSIELGTSNDVDAMITSTLGTDLDQDEIWVDGSPDSEIEPMSAIREYIISNGDDVILTLSAQIDTGEIDFSCFWFPLSTDGSVVAA